jgi:hypothetical protein
VHEMVIQRYQFRQLNSHTCDLISVNKVQFNYCTSSALRNVFISGLLAVMVHDSFHAQGSKAGWMRSADERY